MITFKVRIDGIRIEFIAQTPFRVDIFTHLVIGGRWGGTLDVHLVRRFYDTAVERFADGV